MLYRRTDSRQDPEEGSVKSTLSLISEHEHDEAIQSGDFSLKVVQPQKVNAKIVSMQEKTRVSYKGDKLLVRSS